MPNAVCLPRNEKGKSGQVNKSCQVIPRPTTGSPVDLFLFSYHTGDCWTSGLCVAKIAAKIKHAWLLEA